MYSCMVPKKLYREMRLSVVFRATLRKVLADTARCVSRCSTLHRPTLHVNFPLSIFNFQLHSLFRLSAYHADITLSYQVFLKSPFVTR